MIQSIMDARYGYFEKSGQGNFSDLINRIDADSVSGGEKIRTKHVCARKFAREVIDDSVRKPIVQQQLCLEQERGYWGSLPGVVRDVKELSDFFKSDKNPQFTSILDRYNFAQVVERRQEFVARRLPLPLSMGAVALDRQPYQSSGTIEIRTTVGGRSGKSISFAESDIKTTTIPLDTINVGDELAIARLNRFIDVLQKIVSIPPHDMDVCRVPMDSGPVI